MNGDSDEVAGSDVRALAAAPAAVHCSFLRDNLNVDRGTSAAAEDDGGEGEGFE